jgi:5,10-methylenetetrahydromethanopterin reductase
MEIGTLATVSPDGTGEDVTVLESMGFDVATFGDSQNVLPDPFVRMGFAAAQTSSIRLATLVTPPGTRDPAVTAASIATVQLQTSGRAILGLGSGYSSLGNIGKPYPAPFDEFTRYADTARTYLRRGSVSRHGIQSRLSWLPAGLPLVPVDIVCTGLRTTRFAAGHADRLTLAVGCDLPTVRDRLAVVRAALTETGRHDRDVQVGIQAAVVVTDDIQAGVGQIRSTVAGMAHVGGGGLKGIRVTGEQEIIYRARGMVAAWLKQHDVPDRSGPAYVEAMQHALDDDFIRWFAIIGPPEHVVARFRQLGEAGIKHAYVVFGGPSADDRFFRASRSRFAQEVLPWLR